MATDWLTGYVLDEKIEEILTSDDNINVITNNLIEFANDVSGKDNTSVILIEQS